MGHSPATCAGGAGRRQASSSGSLRTCLRSSGASHTRRSERPILSSVTASPPPRRYDSDPTDPLWQLIEPLLPPPASAGRPEKAPAPRDRQRHPVLSPAGPRLRAAPRALRGDGQGGHDRFDDAPVGHHSLMIGSQTRSQAQFAAESSASPAPGLPPPDQAGGGEARGWPRQADLPAAGYLAPGDTLLNDTRC